VVTRRGAELIHVGAVTTPAYADARISSVRAEMSAAEVNDLPDSAFAYIEPGGRLDETGRTTPRSLRHFPVHDKAHAANALARLSSSPFGQKARPKVEAAARKFGICAPAGRSLTAVAPRLVPVTPRAALEILDHRSVLYRAEEREQTLDATWALRRLARRTR
jgi:hypothetical protein